MRFGKHCVESYMFKMESEVGHLRLPLLVLRPLRRQIRWKLLLQSLLLAIEIVSKRISLN